jgi:flotillin
MNSIPILIPAAVMALVTLVMVAIMISRFVKVRPNQVLIVSGRKVQRPDGSVVGFRIVKSGGTFVFPVLEKAEVLSLEVVPVEMPRAKARAAGGRTVEADGVAQVTINSDDDALAAAMEHFLGKSPAEIGNIARPILEKHLSGVLANSSVEEATQNPAACAAKVQAAAVGDLGKLGLSLVSFTIRDCRPF